MARTILNNRYSQAVNVSVTEAAAGKSLGSANAYRDPRTGITKFEWTLGSVSVNDMNFITLGSAGFAPNDEFFSRINFSIDGMRPTNTTLDGQIFFPKVVLRNPSGFSFSGVLQNVFLQLYILNNDTKVPTKLFYSICVESVFI